MFCYKIGCLHIRYSKAKTACEVAGHTVLDHFADAGEMVSLGSGSQREVPDMMLSCYLIARNGDTRKEEIAFAQTCFAVQTRKLEIIHRPALSG